MTRADFSIRHQLLLLGALATASIGLPYEHVSHLQQAAELLARMRGLVNGALRMGELQPQAEATLTRHLVLYENAMRNYERSVPNATRIQLSTAVDAQAVHNTLELVQRLLLLRNLNIPNLNATGWWSLATDAVDTLQKAARHESTSLSLRANARITEIEHHLQFTVAALVVLGIVTLALVLSTVGRIVKGLDRLLNGLDSVAKRRNFSTRIDETGHDEFGVISSGVNKLIDIASTAVHEQEILSVTDLLTGEMNRRGFDQQLAARTTPERTHTTPLSLIMIDVDHFKSVNDTYGHASGDQVLRGLGRVLRENLRPDDVLARFGGAEFVALLSGCPLDEGIVVAESLRKAIAAYDFGIGRPVTASLGVAQWDINLTPEAFIKAADAQIYVAKGSERNCVMPQLLQVA